MKQDAVVVQEKVTGLAGVLTDGTGVSPFDLTKFIKDFVVDVLKGSAAALTAAQILSLGTAVNQPQVVVFALVSAVLGAAYRAGLRWATT